MKHGLGDVLALLIGVYVWIRVMLWLAPIVGPVGAVFVWLVTGVLGFYGFSWWVDRRKGKS